MSRQITSEAIDREADDQSGQSVTSYALTYTPGERLAFLREKLDKPFVMLSARLAEDLIADLQAFIAQSKPAARAAGKKRAAKPPAAKVEASPAAAEKAEGV